MKIQYTQFCLNPALRGTTTNLPAHRAIALIDAGAAVEVPLPPRGSAGWLAARNEQAAILNPPADANVKWTVSKGEINGRYFISGRCSSGNCTTFNFDSPPDSLTFPGTRQHMELEHLEFHHSCGAFATEKVPAAICAQYRKLWEPSKTLPKDVAIFHRACQPHPTDGKRVELTTFAGPHPGQRPVEGIEKEQSGMFLPTPDLVDTKNLIGPQKGKPIVPGDEITRPI
jgi:hypothetical protein